MTNKTKIILLLLGFLLTLTLCYQLAISKTIELNVTYKDLKQQEALYKNAPRQMSLLKQKQHYYDSLLTKYQLQGNSVQNNLLKSINTFADSTNIKVVHFLEPHKVVNNDITINTYQFTLEGDYNNMVRLIHKLEQKTKFGEIINLHFEKKKNFRTGTFYLQLHVLLKSFG
ncbi:hypothetical protein [Snuella lapsa]|uniref:Uncharacterized protein n=1 Tax=Snuella lapsa TaxID=870481 RepID=A0ABP6WQ48_9FLAO